MDRLFGLASCFSGVTIAGWTTDLAITAPLGISLVLYAVGVIRLWRAAGVARGATPIQVALFLAGWLVLAGALLTPLHDWSRRLFTAHMIEHELVMTLAAPLLILSRPLGPMLWAFPTAWRRSVAVGVRNLAFLLFWDVLTAPLVATVLHAIAIWVWHVPSLFGTALQIEWVHWAQHLSFVFTAFLFWWGVLEGVERGRIRAGGIGLLFVTALHTAVLGALIALSPRPVYPYQSTAASSWNLTPLMDQQLAGIIMWVPGGMVYAGAALTLAALWIGRSSLPQMSRQAAHAE
ncbi:MAG: hypothetical protein JWR75_1436 [Devosia sp.]|nr:hypothetical protein [Devosia sp.]